MSRIHVLTTLFTTSLLVGCATTPLGPTARVLPAPGKAFEAFQRDQTQCNQFAEGEVGGAAGLADAKRIGGAVLATALTAGLGAALNRGHGAGIGAAIGSMVGARTGARGSAGDQAGIQGQYDLAYTQCMYSNGNQVAMPARGPATNYGVAAAQRGPSRW